MAAQPEGGREQFLGSARTEEGPAEGSACKSLPSPPASGPCSQIMFPERAITVRASGSLKSPFPRKKGLELMVKTRTEQKVWPAAAAGPCRGVCSALGSARHGSLGALEKQSNLLGSGNKSELEPQLLCHPCGSCCFPSWPRSFSHPVLGLCFS